ncbi:hypothetical protein DFJ73DRAFT_775197 [Zopfochytrium polystomum]|nr:hypothetical protein DFJ73DRAFT_775197 [Zopfochytrium polystomum]
MDEWSPQAYVPFRIRSGFGADVATAGNHQGSAAAGGGGGGGGSHAVLLIKSHFTRDSYSVFATDLKRFWRETVSRDGVIDRMKMHAAAYLRNDVEKFLPYIRRLIVAQDPTFEYTLTSPLEDDDHDLTILLRGKLNGLALKWVLQLRPVRTPQHHPGDMIVPQIILPLMASLIHAQQEIAQLSDMLESKDKDLKDAADLLAFHNLPKPNVVMGVLDVVEDPLGGIGNVDAPTVQVSQSHKFATVGASIHDGMPSTGRPPESRATAPSEKDKRKAAEDESQLRLQELIQIGEKKKEAVKPKKKKII